MNEEKISSSVKRVEEGIMGSDASVRGSDDACVPPAGT